MGCPRCGRNQGRQVPLPSQAPRPGSNQRPTQPVKITPSDAVRNSISGLRYVPNGK